MAMYNPPHPGEFIRDIYLGHNPESWLLMQDSYDLWQAKQDVDLSGIEPLAIPA